jgi:type IV pilus assembly protein PilO
MTGKLEKLFHFDVQSLKRNRFELTGALVLVLLTTVFYLAWRAGKAESTRLDGLLKAGGAEINAIAAEASTAEGLQRAINDAGMDLTLLEDRLKTINERLPSDRHISRLLADLSENGSGVRITSIKPLPPEDKGELARLPFQINIESGFVPLGFYIEKIEKLPRLMVIDNVTIEPKEEGSRMLNANIFLSAYVLGYGGSQ